MPAHPQRAGFWSTDLTKVPNRVAYWREAICQAILELDFHAKSNQLQARLQRYEFGTIRLCSVSINSAHQVVRSVEAADRATQAVFNLNLVRHGQWLVEHCDRTMTVRAGELVLLDCRRPYVVRAQAGTEHICAQLPVQLLERWLPDPASAATQPIALGTPGRAALAASLCDAADLVRRSPADADLCANQIASGLALALGPQRSGGGGRLDDAFGRVQQVLLRLATQPDLDASQVAASLSVSTRYLFKLLASRGLSYERELIRIRLQFARDMLTNPHMLALSVAEVGHRAGFKDSSHFSRRFKESFRLTPGQYRELSGRQSMN